MSTEIKIDNVEEAKQPIACEMKSNKFTNAKKKNDEIRAKNIKDTKKVKKAGDGGSGEGSSSNSNLEVNGTSSSSTSNNDDDN